DSSERPLDWQQVACALALLGSQCVISGGPGTGKTTTVVRLLLLLRLLDPRVSRIRLCAPTGKAAERLSNSVAGGVAHLRERVLTNPAARATLLSLLKGEPDPGAALAAILDGLAALKATTIHRLLGTRPHTTAATHGPGRPLDCDLLVADEISMVDISLFGRLLSALPQGCRLVMLGDKDQLASVDIGAVLADLCHRVTAGAGRLSAETLRRLCALLGLSDPRLLGGDKVDEQVVVLQKTYRFSGVIKDLAQAVNRCALTPDLLEDCLHRPAAAGDPSYVRWVAASAQGGDGKPLGRSGAEALTRRVVRELLLAPAGGFPDQGPGADPLSLPHSFCEFIAFVERLCAGQGDPAEGFALLAQCRVLCSNHFGPLGTVAINRAMREALLRGHPELAARAEGDSFPGRVVMVTRNDPTLGLYNGDMGFVAPDPQGSLKVLFPGKGEGAAPLGFSPLLLPHIEDGFALTVHKAQGSDYGHVIFLLSLLDNHSLTKELIYTALTRSKRYLTIVGDPLVFTKASARPTERSSGLARRLDAGQG
nr:AAA family ATPase [Succinivibrionaceae bacterium]